jgi:SAM-dependent methyltransferase
VVLCRVWVSDTQPGMGRAMDADARQDQRRRTWGRVASGWAAGSELTEAQQAPISDWLIDRTDPQPGQVVLDLAAGAGGLGHRVADLVGPQGRVISTDFAPEMVAAARQLGEERGLGNVEYRTLDAEQMDLGDDSVDVVLCRSGIMVMADPQAALTESRRVLRAGGALGFSVFTTAAENLWASVGVRPFAQRDLSAPPESGGPGMFSLGDEDRLGELVAGAGFSPPEIERVDYEHRFSDDSAVWRLVAEVNARLAPIVETFKNDEREAMRRAVIDAYAAYRKADGSYSVPACVFAVLAR